MRGTSIFAAVQPRQPDLNGPCSSTVQVSADRVFSYLGANESIRF